MVVPQSFGAVPLNGSILAPFPPMSKVRLQIPRRGGFTLIELLIVVVIIGILAAIATSQYVTVKERARVAGMISDLRSLSSAQEGYFLTSNRYASSAAALTPMFVPTPGNTLTIVSASGAGWSASMVNDRTSITCSVFVNTAPLAPATSEGVPTCK